MCLSFSTAEAIMDLEAKRQADLVTFVTTLSTLCKARIEKEGSQALTTPAEVEAAQRAVRHVWANAQKLMSLSL